MNVVLRFLFNMQRLLGSAISLVTTLFKFIVLMVHTRGKNMKDECSPLNKTGILPSQASEKILEETEEREQCWGMLTSKRIYSLQPRFPSQFCQY